MLDRRQVRLEVELEPDALGQDAAQDRLEPADRGVQIDDARLRELPAREQQQLARQRRGALGRVHDLVRRLGRAAGRERVLEHARVAADHGQQIVEVVRDAAREAADRVHLLRLAQLLLERELLGEVARLRDQVHFARAGQCRAPDDATQTKCPSLRRTRCTSRVGPPCASTLAERARAGFVVVGVHPRRASPSCRSSSSV